MKKILLILSVCFMLFACESKQEYERSSEMGTIHHTKMVDILDRMERMKHSCLC